MLQIILIAIGLSMDAFAVAVCKGLSMRKINKKQTFFIALYFGGFQALMPTLGWLLGYQFLRYIEEFDHWIAFILLGFIGGKMLIEALRDQEDGVCPTEMDPPLPHKELLLLAIATSIDALAVGVSFAVIGTPIFPSVIIIGIITFVLSIVGVVMGNLFGSFYKKGAEICGGVILILIGVHILVEHLGIL